ncbi:MAG: 2-C-methyl-D-erythritol 4-phosphate cytidylyltransferase, partial [Longimicrobiales bacterium]
MTRDVGVIMAAAGAGLRFGGPPKQFTELRGEPLLVHALRPFLEHSRVLHIVVALPGGVIADPPNWLPRGAAPISLVTGGEARAESVREALEALDPAATLVVVHDAARPLVTAELVDRVVAAAADVGAAIAGVRATDTIKEVDADGRVVRTPSRDRLWHAQTPQAFRRALLERAFDVVGGRAAHATDEAMLVEWLGEPVAVVEGSP